jgi:hypothetical protein
MPEINMPEIKIPEINIPEIKIPEINIPEMSEIKLLLEKIIEVLKMRIINVFHVLVVAPMLAYIGYLAVNNKPISFGNGLIYLAIGIGAFHLSKIVDSFMNYTPEPVPSTESPVTATLAPSTESPVTTTLAPSTEAQVTVAPVTTTLAPSTESLVTEVPVTTENYW